MTHEWTGYIFIYCICLCTYVTTVIIYGPIYLAPLHPSACRSSQSEEDRARCSQVSLPRASQRVKQEEVMHHSRLEAGEPRPGMQ